MSQKVTTFIMFNDQSEAAMNLYASIIPNCSIVSTFPGPDGGVAGGSFEIEGQRFLCYNAGPHPNFAMSSAFSLMIEANTQEEIDALYDGLSEGGEQQPCGWLVDKFGLSWQITPKYLMDNLNHPDRERSMRVTQAMFKMTKIIIADLKAAAAG
ncbi:MAG TPA: VOC family protein [Pyrinomonadaceae bacterium]|nr:VOC family protein [Pyrinomonadaceae bacterium]